MALNVTTAVFGENCNTATASPSLAQWDQGQKLKIEGVDLPASYQVEFSTAYTRNAIQQIGDTDGVTIPNVLLQRSAPITAYIVLHGSAGSRDTEYWVTIHITPRTPPETVTPDPEEMSVIDQTIAALEAGAARAEAAADAAEGSASNAADYAADAEAWAVGQRAGADVPSTDETYQNNAKYYAGEAEAAAEEAGQHEASWESWVRRAETAADDAEGSARAAAGSKADAETAAQTATQKANAAASSATEAANSASEAAQTVAGGVGAINTARDGALNAVNQAGTTQTGAVNQAGANQVAAVNQAGATQVQAVEDKGDEVLDSIPQDYSELVDDVADLNRQLNDETTGLDTKAPVILDTASGAIASFDDGADGMPIKKLIANVEPVQDLHGYTNPWPGGGGVNKWDFLHPASAQNATVTENSDGTFVAAGSTASAFLRYLVPVTANKRHILFCSKSNAIGNTNVLGLVNVFDGSDSSAAPLLTNALIADSAKAITPTGDYIFIVFTVTGGSGSGSATVSQPFIIAADEGTPVYSPYSNICPISGWTGAEVQQTGINAWDEQWEIGGISLTTGANTTATNRIRSKNYIPVKPGTAYCLNLPWVSVCAYDADKNFIAGNQSNNQPPLYIPNASDDENPHPRTWTVPDGVYYIRFHFTTTYGTAYKNDSGVNYPATDTTYHAYTRSNQISVTFPTEAGDNGTVYGSTLAINPDRTGTLVVDRAADDLGSMSWAYSSAYGGFFATQSIKDVVSGQTWKCKCERYNNLRLTSDVLLANDCAICINAENGNVVTGAQVFKALMVLDKKYNGDVESFKSAVSGTKVVYELASSQPYQLTAEQVSDILTTLYGTNNIWASTGDVDVTYPADTKLFIEKLTQPTEDDMTADHAISAGTFFQLGNTLYLATAAIAAGATITPGTNATKLSLADALNQLNT